MSILNFIRSKQLAHNFEVPLEADRVDSPIVQYGDVINALHFMTEDNHWGRITFERLDSIKASRGEYAPYPLAPGEKESFYWVQTISNSRWLRERYKYEKKYYGDSYGFNGDVDEMIREFSHYVFHFHDQFIEVLAAGIWFESADSILGERYIGERYPEQDHPLSGLHHLETSETFEGSGIICYVRRNPLSESELEKRAQLCSQTILEIKIESDVGIGPDWTLTRRVHSGVGKTYLRSCFGNPEEIYAHIPTLIEIRPHIDRWLAEISQRRKDRDKE
ncbi:hypothetical protein [uncultured Gimesia sp.]|uniref:hypothetical protein n=1 Tax=uncultured Gimesia sp. TaxID=1678688 RepID=UPI00263585AE|nr:hypothetical protein [uncultured Gimesia sp.]